MENSVFICILLSSILLINHVHAGVSREQMEKMADGFRKTCIGKTGADMVLVQDIRNGKFVEDPASKCYTKCIMGLMRTFTKQGDIDIEMMIKQVNIMGTPELAERMSAAARTCFAEVSADDGCELAWRFTMCLHANDPEIFFFP